MSSPLKTQHGSLRTKIFLLTFGLVVFSLLSYSLYSISSLRSEKRRLLYYAVQIENSVLFEKASELLLRSETELLTKCPKLIPPYAVLNAQGRTIMLGDQSCSMGVDLAKIYGNLATQSSANVYFYDVVSGKTLILAQPVAGPINIEKTDPLILAAQKSPGSQGIVDFKRASDGEEFVGSFSKLQNGRFLLLTETKRQGLVSELRSLVWNLFLFALILGAVCLVAGITFSSRLIRPLEKLMLYADNLAAGRYDANPKIDSNDEISELSNHFSRLGERLSERDKQLEAASDLATRDGLTGLHNYRYFKSKLEEYLALARRQKYSLGVILMDVDHFKAVNDTYGHPQGDLVLKVVSSVVKSSCRTTDIVCRYGGEEFVVLAPETGMEGTKQLAEKIRKAIENTAIEILGDAKKMTKTASFGVAVFNPDHPDVAKIFGDTLIRDADSRLYVAKRNGRNQVVVD